jgi:hypothetical protein
MQAIPITQWKGGLTPLDQNDVSPFNTNGLADTSFTTSKAMV